MQIVLLISDFKEDKAWFISKAEDYELSVKLSEAASPRLQLGRKNLPPSDCCPDYEFNITVGVWEVRQVKPGNRQTNKAHSCTCMCTHGICHTDFKIEQ